MIASEVIDAVFKLVPEDWNDIETTRGRPPELSPRQTVLARIMREHGGLSDTKIAAALDVREAVVKNALDRSSASKYSWV